MEDVITTGRQTFADFLKHAYQNEGKKRRESEVGNKTE